MKYRTVVRFRTQALYHRSGLWSDCAKIAVMSDTVATAMPDELPQLPELPVVQPEPGLPERADAVRNRGKVLAAAERLFAEHGAGCVSMDAVAAEAGVGKGTLFRRFGDRAGLAQAVLSERSRRFQDAIIRGPAPLGPGAPPVDRLVAFGEQYLEAHGQHLDLLLVAEWEGARMRSAPYAFWRMHVAMLVREADPELDDEFVADVLLGALAAPILAHLEGERGLSRERIAAGWGQLVRRLLGAA
jgi:AcrR family transcriptional regulator